MEHSFIIYFITGLWTSQHIQANLLGQQQRKPEGDRYFLMLDFSTTEETFIS